jgi:hypothetical protein
MKQLKEQIKQRKKALGAELKLKRQSKGLTPYHIEKESKRELNCNQIKGMESGQTSYTIDSYLHYQMLLNQEV